MPEIYLPTSKKELSQRKLLEYERYSNVINWGRQNPVKFAEYMLGIQLMDYQRWCFMQTWEKPFALWLCCRGAGKTSLLAVYLQTKLLLIPDYRVYISTNSAAQSIEVFKKLEDIAMQRIPSFKSCTDLFLHEVEKSANSETGFIHDPAGHRFRLFNNSELITLSTNINALRGKRGSVVYDETAWQTAEQMAATEHFIDVDSTFSLSTNGIEDNDPLNMPLQLIYASSAGDVTYPFYGKYKSFAKKMIIGDPSYFVCDLNANTIVNYSTVNGTKIKSHLTQKQIEKSLDEDPDLAERELFNKFRRGSGANAIVSMETLINNSEVRKPIMYNNNSKRKFIFCYDPARNFDGSILGVFELIDDKENGYMLYIVNVVSMVDKFTAKKTPLPMPEQLRIIKELLIKYNGNKALEWENVDFYIDAGSGGGGISAVADNLMDNWVDSFGTEHRGIIDPDHKQYTTAREKYKGAAPIVHLIEPRAYRNIMFDALAKMTKLGLVKFTEYDNKDYILVEDKKGSFIQEQLSDEEKISLIQINLMKNEIAYMCRYDSPSGVQFDLARDKRNTMHDDRAYVVAMACYVLAKMRRTELIEDKKSLTYDSMPSCVSSFTW